MTPFYSTKNTPLALKYFIGFILLLSLLSPPLTFFFHHSLALPGPSDWFSLSRWGIREGWLWQPLTYAFIHSAGSTLSLSFAFFLFFQMLLLWVAGSDLISRFGTRAFFFFYLGGSLLVGIVAALALFFFPTSAILYGSGPPVYALLMVWAMLHPDLELFFFLIIRMKAKWVVALLLGLSLLSFLASGEWLSLLANGTGLLWGFVIGRRVWKLQNPYPLNLAWPKKSHSTGKIIDISVLQEEDNAFVDRMLEKIASKGKSSLTYAEQARLDEIAKRKRKS